MKESRIAKEGMKLIIPSFLLSCILFYYQFFYYIPAVIIALFCLFCLYFFRNPRRCTGDHPEDLISPADGKVTGINEMKEDDFIGGECRRISIFMSPADVHVNRAPCDGRIIKMVHVAGDFAVAFKKDIDKENERNHILMEHGSERIMLVQIAGFLARRIIPYVKEEETVGQCDPVGIIAFGSRVDIYFPLNYEPVVQLGSKVKAGLTLLAQKKREL